jgi:hypothetical protein
MRVLGIDPGLDGGLVLIDKMGAVLDYHPMPVIKRTGKRQKKREPDLQGIMDLCLKLNPTKTYLEQVSSRSGNGSVSMFNFGFGFGVLLMGLTALRLDYALVRPQTWCKEMHRILPESIRTDKQIEAKQRSRMVFDIMYPDLPLRKKSQRETTIHSGMMDALLIAEYGRRDILTNLGEY